MTSLQLSLTVGLPTFAIMISMVATVMQSNALGSRITSLEGNMNARFTSLENRFTSLESRFDTLVGKVVEVDNRLTRVEAILDRH